MSCSRSAISLILIGLTNKVDAATFTIHEWTEPQVGGLIAVGGILLLAFLWAETRAKEADHPARPLAQPHLRVVDALDLPRQLRLLRRDHLPAALVPGRSRRSPPRRPGYLTFPLLIGLIGSSIISGQIIARTGRYKALLVGSIVTMTAGVAMMTQITADTEFPILFFWMFVTGLGIGPTLAGFTIVVQNAVPFQKLGVATSNLTFFRQIGGSIGLAIAGTQFASSLGQQIPAQVGPVFAEIKATVPPAFQGQFDQLGQAAANGGGGLDLSQLTGVGQSFGKAISEFAASQAGPAADQVRAVFTPFIAQLDHAFFQAFSLAIGETFFIGVVTGIGAIITASFMKELPLRTTLGAEQAPATAPGATPAGIPAGVPQGAPQGVPTGAQASDTRPEAPRVPRPATD